MAQLLELSHYAVRDTRYACYVSVSDTPQQEKPNDKFQRTLGVQTVHHAADEF